MLTEKLSEQALLQIPKADMHVHLEGTMTPEMMKRIAARNGVPVPEGLMAASGTHFTWPASDTAHGSLMSFVKAYDDATMVMRTAQDYTDLTYDYLARAAAEGCIYAEITISADHGAMVGLSYPEMMAAIQKGYEQARNETGIEARFLSVCVRHYGPEKALAVGELTAAHPHPLVTGFTTAGDENAYSFRDFLPAFAASGLKNRMVHAGEAAGPESVRDALAVLKPQRFGHMVRASEDAALMRELKDAGAVPEVCVSSNMALKAYPDHASHPLRRFFDFGFRVVLGSDDPAFFGNSIGAEYRIAHESFGFTARELLQLTRNAVETAFVDETLRRRLRARVDAACALPDVQPECAPPRAAGLGGKRPV